MNDLYQILPKELVYIIEDYAVDTSHYQAMISDLHKIFKELSYCIHNNYFSEHTDLGFILVHSNTKIYDKHSWLSRRHWKSWQLMIKRNVVTKYFNIQFRTGQGDFFWPILGTLNK